ncbi:cysteine synthase A [Oxynema sp. CENA135]|uniref:cysteine synthase A n=1 Tax=Oxynema sp. CENA135 TaxID=984206 RepID=UPI00190BA22F|nr:cysteine synthase A [Oxynema sp. CENA135]MBK4730879.1 cysteine synthase A [Oxynema sp. CENA135]
MKIHKSINEVIGNTPLIRLQHLPQDCHCNAEIILKLEGLNPGRSIKDRIAVSMIEEAEKGGLIQRGSSTIIEATSGNTGIGLAMVCAANGYRLILTMPDNMSQERQQLLKAYGAEVVTTPAKLDMAGAIARANELLASIPNSFSPQQFSNPANPKIHYQTTGPEIWADTEGKIDVLVVGVGTGGTLTGAGYYLKQKKPELKIIAVEPTASAVLSGKNRGIHDIQGIGAGFIPDVLRQDLIDEVVQVTEEKAYKIGLLLAEKEGIMSGISTGAVVSVALEIGAGSDYRDRTIVTIQASGGERYLSTQMFQPQSLAAVAG